MPSNPPKVTPAPKDYWNGYAFVGGLLRGPVVRRRLEGRRFECYVSRRHFLRLAGLSLAFGVLIPAALWFTRLADAGWAPKAGLLAFAAFFCWQLWGNLRSRCAAVVDGEARTIELFGQRGAPPIVRLGFDDVADIRVESFWRPIKSTMMYPRVTDPEKVPTATYRCAELSLHLTDGRRLALVESTDQDQMLEIERQVTVLVVDGGSPEK